MKSKFFPHGLRLMTVFIMLLAALAPVGTAHAATCTVTTDADSGAGSLREKIADPTCDTITFDGDYTVPLASELNIDRNLTIDGAGHNVTVSGDTNSDGTSDVRVFDVYPGVTFNLNQLTVTKGYAGNGGGIYNNGGTVTLTNSTFSANSANSGGGFYNYGGTVTLTNGTFSANSASTGGAIFNFSGTVHIINSTFESNTVTSKGGGIYIRAGIVNITSSAFSGNRATGSGYGGAIALSITAILNITDSTLSGNSASITGGGIMMEEGTVGITNSTISGNHANWSGGAGGISSQAGTVTLRNTIVANNTGAPNCKGAITDGGGNLVWGDTSCPGINADPKLSALADNGGPTQTAALQSGSAAIDAADPANCPATDQRGYGRDGACDIGAYEYNSATTPDLTIAKVNDVGGTTTLGSAFNWMLTITNGASTAMWFTSPEVILRDNLPSSGATYGTPLPGDFVGVTNSDNISCSISNNDLTCRATGEITIAASGGFEVVIPVTPSASGTLQNPRSGGVCRVDPDGVITESDDGNNDCNSDSVTVNPANTITTVASSQNPSAVGQSVTFTASVAPTEATGTIAFKDNGTDIAGCSAQPLTSGQASCSTSALTVGTHVITAEYSGHASYAASTGTLSPDQQVNCSSAITVTNANDSGAGSLRQAITDVCTGGTITFDGDYTITLASQLTIDKNLTIDGAGYNVTVSGNNAVRVFYVNLGVTFNLQNLTVANGYCGSGCLVGGGVENRGTLNVTNTTFSDNSATAYGGGIENYHGTLTITNSAFTGNTANDGGAIYNSNGVISLTDVTFSGNSATHSGGGMYNNNSSAMLTNITFSGNSATGDGGAIYNNLGSLALTNVTISGNSAGDYGGGICDFEGNLALANVILSGNSGYGQMLIDHSGGGSMTMQNTIVWGSIEGTGFGSPTYIYADPLLAPLGDYGGGTQTFALLPGSPAIDAGDDSACPATDQRGVARPQGAHCDIGAFESQGFTFTISGGDGQSTLINSAFADPLALTVTSAFGEPVDGGEVTFTPPASGASATITGSPAAIAGGAASVTTTANGIVGGPYNVVASASGAPGVNFSLTNTPPLDSTPPEITPQINGTLGQNGWYVSDVTLTWTVVDEESEITSTSGCNPISITGDQLETAYTCEATSAGGTGSESVSIKRDATPPVVAVTGVTEDSAYILGAVPAAVCSTTDVMSGVGTDAGLTLTGGNSLGVGSFTAACDGALDNAGNSGNTAVVHYNITFLFTGFFSPVDNNGVRNIAKAGQTIPLKWRITDANGNPITNLTSVTVTAVSLACSAGTSTDQIEEYAAGNSGLQNLGDGYYQWNWKTPKSYANSCKTLRLDLGEGAGFEHIALFQFKK